MNDTLKAFLIFMAYLLLQASILAVFATLVWGLILAKPMNLHLNYFHWFGILFIAGILRFDAVDKINAFNKLFGSNEIR